MTGPFRRGSINEQEVNISMVKPLVLSLVSSHKYDSLFTCSFLPDWYCVVPGQHGLSRRTWRRTRFWRSWSRRAQSSLAKDCSEHLKILKINLGFVSLLDYEGGLLDRILWKMVQQRSFCASKIIRLMFVIVFISFWIYCTNQIVGKNIGIVAQQWCLLVFLNLLWLSRETRLNLFILQNSENIVLNYGPSADC